MKENTLNPIDEFTDPMRDPPIDYLFGKRFDKWPYKLIVQGGLRSKRFTLVSGSGFGNTLQEIAISQGLSSASLECGSKCTTTTKSEAQKDEIIEALKSAGDRDEQGVPIGRPAVVDWRPNPNSSEGGFTRRGNKAAKRKNYVYNLPPLPDEEV